MLQFNDLLTPISEVSPTGEDMSFSPEHDEINKARQFDDPTLDQGEWVTDIKEADWEFVYEKCISLLCSKTKDLRISAWLVEAATKNKQFDGMAAGLELMAQLCEKYWDVMHPLIEDNDTEQRVGNFAWLLTRSVQLVKEVPLTEGKDSAYSWADFEAARARANFAVRTGETATSSASQPDISVLEAARRKSSKTFFEVLIQGVKRCQAASTELETNLDVQLGNEGPSFSQLKETLSTLLATLVRYGADVGLKSTDGVAASAEDKDSNVTGADGVPAAGFSGPIKTRDHAIEQLRQVAEFFRRTEPHSPVAYLADKAANWGDLPLHAWLKTVVKDPNSLVFIEEMLGIQNEARSSST